MPVRCKHCGYQPWTPIQADQHIVECPAKARSEAYDAIDSYLRNNLGDEAYARYAGLLKTIHIPSVEQALRQAFQLGQTYCEQADSDSYKQNKKSDDTLKKFQALLAETSGTGDKHAA